MRFSVGDREAQRHDLHSFASCSSVYKFPDAVRVIYGGFLRCRARAFPGYAQAAGNGETVRGGVDGVTSDQRFPSAVWSAQRTLWARGLPQVCAATLDAQRPPLSKSPSEDIPPLQCLGAGANRLAAQTLVLPNMRCRLQERSRILKDRLVRNIG